MKTNHNPCARWVAIKKGRLFWDSKRRTWTKDIWSAKCFDSDDSAYRSVGWTATEARLVSIEVDTHSNVVQVPYKESNKLGYLSLTIRR